MKIKTREHLLHLLDEFEVGQEAWMEALAQWEKGRTSVIEAIMDGHYDMEAMIAEVEGELEQAGLAEDMEDELSEDDDE